MNRLKYATYMEKKAISPLENMLGGIALGGTAGTGVAWLNNDDYFKNALIGAGIGSIPGVIQTLQQYLRSYKDIGGKSGLKWYEPFILDPKKLSTKSPEYKRNLRPLLAEEKGR